MKDARKISDRMAGKTALQQRDILADALAVALADREILIQTVKSLRTSMSKGWAASPVVNEFHRLAASMIDGMLGIVERDGDINV